MEMEAGKKRFLKVESGQQPHRKSRGDRLEQKIKRPLG
jgi:hypothetical protein